MPPQQGRQPTRAEIAQMRDLHAEQSRNMNVWSAAFAGEVQHPSTVQQRGKRAMPEDTSSSSQQAPKRRCTEPPTASAVDTQDGEVAWGRDLDVIVDQPWESLSPVEKGRLLLPPFLGMTPAEVEADVQAHGESFGTLRQREALEKMMGINRDATAARGFDAAGAFLGSSPPLSVSGSGPSMPAAASGPAPSEEERLEQRLAEIKAAKKAAEKEEKRLASNAKRAAAMRKKRAQQKAEKEAAKKGPSDPSAEQ